MLRRNIYDDIGKIVTSNHQIINKEIALDEFLAVSMVMF